MEPVLTPAAEEASERRQSAHLAAIVLAEIRTRLEDREERWIARLLSAHRDGNLSEPLMRSAVAAIAELRGLRSDLEHEIRLGQS
jgi:hypothetical protein